MSTPVVQVVGFTHTTMLGLIEIGLGLALLMSAATRSRSGEVFFGAVLGIAGFVGAVQTESFKKTLALESSMAWLAVAIGCGRRAGSTDAAPLRPAVDSRHQRLTDVERAIRARTVGESGRFGGRSFRFREGRFTKRRLCAAGSEC